MTSLETYFKYLSKDLLIIIKCRTPSFSNKEAINNIIFITHTKTPIEAFIFQ